MLKGIDRYCSETVLRSLLPSRDNNGIHKINEDWGTIQIKSLAESGPSTPDLVAGIFITIVRAPMPPRNLIAHVQGGRDLRNLPVPLQTQDINSLYLTSLLNELQHVFSYF